MNDVHSVSARDRLRERLVGVAGSQIATAGLGALKARDIAAEAGCALGGIYTAFGDLSELILAVSAETQLMLDSALGAVVERLGAAPPREIMITLAQAYFDFAHQHRNRWDALFAFRLPGGGEAPAWFKAEQDRIFGRLEAPLGQLCPQLEGARLSLAARSVFSAVHGVIALGLDQRLAAVDRCLLWQEVERVVAALAAGFPAACG
jgi:AcrR family transcriptional regulator